MDISQSAAGSYEAGDLPTDDGAIRPSRQGGTFALWAAQVLAVVSLAIGTLIDVESIIGTGPLVTIIGLALAQFSRPLHSPLATGFALSGPLVCVLVAMLIASLQWSPREASGPVAFLCCAYALLVTPLAVATYRRIQRWPQQPPLKNYRWKYNLKSLLFIMTAACVLVGIGQWMFRKSPSDDYLIFTLFSLITLTLIAVVTYKYFADRDAP